MPVNTILRGNANALIEEQLIREIVQGTVTQSAVLSLFRRLPNMTSNVTSMPVLDMLPVAYWVDGDTGQKQTTKVEWSRKKIYAAEIAVIVPIPEAVLDDANYDIWGEITPRLVEAFGKKIDQAVLFGVEKPTQWRDSIIDTIESAGNTVIATDDLYADIYDENGVISKVEQSGFLPNTILSAIPMRGKLRGLRDENKRPLFVDGLRDSATPYALDGMPMVFPNNGAWDNEKALMICGDMSQAVYSIRQDMTYKLLTEGVIQNGDGSIAHNLAQNDMVALRVVMRLGWEIPNPINSIQTDSDLRCAFSVYKSE